MMVLLFSDIIVHMFYFVCLFLRSVETGMSVWPTCSLGQKK